jgi:drug/metabolite transporter (DMT)-like permease
VVIGTARMMGRDSCATLQAEPDDADVSTVVVYAVLGAGLIHAVWNAIAKSFHDQFVSFALLNFGIAVVCWVSWPFIGLPRSASLGYLAFSVLCHLGYELFLMRSYQRSDFSQSYPIARGLAPLLVTLGGLVFASEHLSVPVLIGVMAVVIGIASLAARRGDARMVQSGLLWALATGAAIATYTVVDGLGVRSSHSALRYAAALFAVQSGMWLAGSVLGRGNRPWPSPRLTGLGMLSGVLSMVGYVIVLWAQIRAPLGIVSALRETGVLWAAVIGAVVFHERRLRQVAVPALLVAAGISLLGFG